LFDAAESDEKKESLFFIIQAGVVFVRDANGSLSCERPNPPFTGELINPLFDKAVRPNRANIFTFFFDYLLT